MLKRDKDGVIYGANEGSIIYAALIADGFNPIVEEKNKDSNDENQEAEELALEDMKLEDLKVVAKQLGLSGYSNLKKDELIEIIEPMKQIKGC